MSRRVATPVEVVWFKRDLRIVDHHPLTAAARAGPVLPLLIVEPDYWREPDSAPRHYDFMRESASELNDALSALGQPLAVRVGDAVDILEAIRRTHGIARLWSHEETGNRWTFARDRRVADWARTHGISWNEHRQDGVVRRLASRDGWAQRWNSRMSGTTAEPPLALPPLPSVEPGTLPSASDIGLTPGSCPQRQIGGRDAALSLLSSFLTTRGRHYRRAMSSPLAGATACSRLSLHLAWGTISTRETAQAAWLRAREVARDGTDEGRDWRGAMSSFSGRLHWHCHFMQKLESEPAIEFREFHPSMRGIRPEIADRRLLDAWAAGETGFPFLDACLRSLAATGWLNFRMRAMAISFASYNLWLPWRDTGLVLARLFTDYEPGIHWPQVQMQSGTTGINTIRVYNVVKQGYDQDPDARFVRQWVPELAAIPDAFVHEPWRWDGAKRVLGQRYPERIVDEKLSAAEAKARIFKARQASGFARTSDRIQDRHGSRKSGIPMRGNTIKKTAKPVNSHQLKFDL